MKVINARDIFISNWIKSGKGSFILRQFYLIIRIINKMLRLLHIFIILLIVFVDLNQGIIVPSPSTLPPNETADATTTPSTNSAPPTPASADLVAITKQMLKPPEIDQDVDEGKCLKKWPKHAKMDYKWFDGQLQKGFKVPLANKMYFDHYGKELTTHAVGGAVNYDKLCIKVTNNPGSVFASMTGAPLPGNWEAFSTDAVNGGIFFKLANQATHSYMHTFFLATRGYENKGVVDTCKSNKKENWIKECITAESEVRGMVNLGKRHQTNWVVTKTNNQTYAVVVNCFVNEDKKAWYVLSKKKKIGPKKLASILRHVKDMGFDENKAVLVPYKKKNCN